MLNGKKTQSPGANSCCAGTTSTVSVTHHSDTKTFYWVCGQVTTAVADVSQVSTKLTFRDIFGSWRARWSIKKRMNYKVPPGLYAMGNPDTNSPVLVTANYKMSFDRLRQELSGLNLWVLVLDTKGVNVWCAAGKGTFCSKELVKQIFQARLPEIVTHRTLVLPQLAASGVAAHEVLKLSGFKVIYGPIRAKDISTFLQAGLQTNPLMRQVSFSFMERMELTPIEFMGAIKPTLAIAAIYLVASYHHYTTLSQLLNKILTVFSPYVGAIVVGTILVPVLLPYIPGRIFAWKGWLLGFIWTLLYIYLLAPGFAWVRFLTYTLLLPPIASYYAMNFTGATPYTSFSGVAKEMKFALPAQIISFGLGIVLLLSGSFMKF